MIDLGEGKTFDELMEAKLSKMDKAPKYIKRGIPRSFNVQVVLTQPGMTASGGDKKIHYYADPVEFPELASFELNKRIVHGKNLITDDGDLYYAQQAAGESPTNDFSSANGRQELGNGTQGTPNKTNTYSALIGPVTASRKIIDATYPKTNDGDSDNTGSGTDIVTWLTSWTKADFNSVGLSGGVVHNAAGSPAAGSVLLTYWTITAFDKTADDTLKVFINHEFRGV